jgi:hypothetical protein
MRNTMVNIKKPNGNIKKTIRNSKKTIGDIKYTIGNIQKTIGASGTVGTPELPSGPSWRPSGT